MFKFSLPAHVCLRQTLNSNLQVCEVGKTSLPRLIKGMIKGECVEHYERPKTLKVIKKRTKLLHMPQLALLSSGSHQPQLFSLPC